MKVEIHIPAIRVEQIENNELSSVETHDETKVVIKRDVTENPNFDYYLQPKGDLLYDYFGHSDKLSYGGVDFEKTGEARLNFVCYPDEIRHAAKVRAAEDWCHEVQTLADWLCRAQNNHEGVAGVIEEALEEASKRYPEAQYKVEIGGGADCMEDTTDGSLDGNGVKKADVNPEELTLEEL